MRRNWTRTCSPSHELRGVSAARVYHYEAYSAVPGEGNPAGVVLPGNYPVEVMQAGGRAWGQDSGRTGRVN
ncbi:MAG: hypothetical protein JWO38_5003 [Gemmataceae bacterium]|nr:hypothetical protein [Gemmataceae bacterium]